MNKKVNKKKSSENVTTRRDVQRLIDKANKRIKRLEKDGFQSAPAYKWLEENLNGDYTNKFSIKGMNEKEVERYKHKVLKFLSLKTSTLSGARKALKDSQEALKKAVPNGRELNIDMNDENVRKNFWYLYNALQEYRKAAGEVVKSTDPTAIDYINRSIQVHDFLSEKWDDLSPDNNESMADMIKQIATELRYRNADSENDIRFETLAAQEEGGDGYYDEEYALESLREKKKMKKGKKSKRYYYI